MSIKKFNITLLISTLLTLAVFIMPAFAGSENKFKPDEYIKIAKKAILDFKNPTTLDVNASISDMNKLIEIAAKGCKEHIADPGTPAKEGELLSILLKNKEKMTKLTLKKIEEQWHEGGLPRNNFGIDIEKWDHFSDVLSHYDSVIHPATAIICLNNWKQSKNKSLLTQAIDELAEVIEHMKALGK